MRTAITVTAIFVIRCPPPTILPHFYCDKMNRKLPATKMNIYPDKINDEKFDVFFAKTMQIDVGLGATNVCAQLCNCRIIAGIWGCREIMQIPCDTLVAGKFVWPSIWMGLAAFREAAWKFIRKCQAIVNHLISTIKVSRWTRQRNALCCTGAVFRMSQASFDASYAHTHRSSEISFVVVVVI